jgi:hypothetical protein
MKTTCLFLLTSALLTTACTHDKPDNGNGNGSGDGDGKLSVVDWANDMARAEQPDTIQDKFAIVIDTDDPNAFVDVIQVAKDQAAAAAAAGD